MLNTPRDVQLVPPQPLVVVPTDGRGAASDAGGA